MRLQITVDDALGEELKKKADYLGLSLSSYVRFLIKRELAEANGVSLDDRVMALTE